MARNGKNTRKTAVRDITRIEAGILYFEDVRQCLLDDDAFSEIIEYEKAFRVVSLSSEWVDRQWVSWEMKADTQINVEMTLRAEMRSGRKYWYAYRTAGGKLYKRYVGTSEQITTKRLVEIAKKLP